MKASWIISGFALMLPLSACSAADQQQVASIALPVEFHGDFAPVNVDCKDVPSGLGVWVRASWLDYGEGGSTVLAIRPINDNEVEVDLRNETGSDVWNSTDRLSLHKGGESLVIQRLTENGAPYPDSAPIYYGRCK